MRLAAPRNEDALKNLGLAQFGSVAISHEYDEEDSTKIVAYVVPDELDLTGYNDAVAALSKPPVPASISDRQFAQALAKDGTITQTEALSLVRTGTLPKALQDVVDAMTDRDEAFDATMLLSGATTFERAHPMVETLGKALGKSDAELDNLWISAGAL